MITGPEWKKDRATWLRVSGSEGRLNGGLKLPLGTRKFIILLGS